MAEKRLNLYTPPYFRLANKRGSILVVALWMISVMSLFAISAGFSMRQKVSLSERLNERNELLGFAERGVAQGMFGILQKKKAYPDINTYQDPFLYDANLYRFVHTGRGTFSVVFDYIGGEDENVTVKYGVQDEEQKINLNMSDTQTMTRLFQMVCGIDERVAEEIAYSIEDWRDSNSSDSSPDYEAEDEYYDDLPEPYEAKDAPLESLEELLSIRGVTPEIFQKIKPYVTVYGSGAVNINTASRPVLAALGMEESLINNIMKYRNGPDRENGTDDDRMFHQAANIAFDLNKAVSIDSSAESKISQLVSETKLGIASTAFMIHSRGEWAQKRQAIDLYVVANLDGKILSWFTTGIPRPMSAAEFRLSQGESS